MSGGESWASTLPSTNSTIEWTTLSGWTTTSIWSGSRPKSQRASIDLQRLVHQRGRVDRDLRPHPPGRVPQRLRGGDVRPARGATGPGTGRRRRSGSPGAPPAAVPACSAWKIAECSLSTGRSVRPATPGQVHHQRAGDDQRLLVGQGDDLARLQRRPGPAQAGRADDRAEDPVGLGVLDHPDQPVGPRQRPRPPSRAAGRRREAAASGSVRVMKRGRNAWACSTSASPLEWALRPRARSRAPPSCAITLSALRPIEPVEPRTTTLVKATPEGIGVLGSSPRRPSSRDGRAGTATEPRSRHPFRARPGRRGRGIFRKLTIETLPPGDKPGRIAAGRPSFLERREGPPRCWRSAARDRPGKSGKCRGRSVIEEQGSAWGARDLLVAEWVLDARMTGW